MSRRWNAGSKRRLAADLTRTRLPDSADAHETVPPARPERTALGQIRRSVPLALALLAGCAVGPRYQRPALDTPAAYRPARSDGRDLTAPESLGDLDWREVMPDPQLRAYVAEALTNSWDIKAAAARVLQAEAAARAARSQFLPAVGVGGDWATARSSQRGAAAIPRGVGPEAEQFSAYATMASYELDLWGRIRRANQAARARLLATEAARQTVLQTLVAQVATAYLSLLELDCELEIAQNTLEASSDSLALTTAREEGGVASMQDVQQARILVATAQAAIAETHRRIEHKENELSLLLGRNPESPARGEGLLRQRLGPAVPPGLPSSLIERRPDIRAAEQALVAANADIGQAKAAFFPQVTLTGLYGYQAVDLSDLFTAPARTWQFGPAVSAPVFTGGALRANLRLARAKFDEALAQYQRTVQTAFHEVSDALIAYQRTREFRVRQEERTEAHRGATELANTRYEGGVTSYLEVLYNEQELFTSELVLAQARLNELLSVVQLYRALGGGWQAAAPLENTFERN
ncbi:MAG: efflux transporter outer membrane subunit [Verrucomicrobia bacterium]|nr:efflux transporter outer membrane subunit [Verrucomicrobiota bacterium]OQC62942.1 MAG: Outer membrane protein OprM precursor [Verrucomicrobia bacterium ADurb.Bin006]MDI9380708.1 efflux transporter outer membrane subunit [Verrucomicrobiota bacterium]NMD21146.1 efflux transporter outer membrane subunit [Verrucomicrobiota bacterium]HNU98309.1 efflux transporter outer membrane subunit [Verrucomicrobiota bacterium]